LTALALDDRWIDYFEVNPYPISINAAALASHLRSWLSDRDLSLVVPLVARARLVALLAVSGGASSHEFSADDLLFLMTLADEAAAAIRLAQMCHAQAETVDVKREPSAATAGAVSGRR
jgi:GAF domain-containing protein